MIIYAFILEKITIFYFLKAHGKLFEYHIKSVFNYIYLFKHFGK